MSSLLPLGADHQATEHRMRRYRAACIAQAALCALRAHVLPSHADTGRRHGP